MEVTLFGNVIPPSEVQYQKALFPIDVISSCKLTVVKPPQPLNKPSDISLMPLGIVISVKAQSEKAYSPIDVKFSGNTRLRIFMGHRTKRIGWWRVEKWVKMVVYKELGGLWRLRLHKTKRLHWFNFGLHRGAFRLHEAGERFTHIGLHVYACGLFRCCAWKTLYTRVFKAYRGFICAQVWTERVRY